MATTSREQTERNHLTRMTTRSLGLILTDPESQPVHALIRRRRAAAPTPWLKAAESTMIREMMRVAASIHRDEQAARNGCRVICSQGIVEGFNRQLKR